MTITAGAASAPEATNTIPAWPVFETALLSREMVASGLRDDTGRQAPGVAEALADSGLRPELARKPGYCCVVFQPAPGAPRTKARQPSVGRDLG
jgi:hypothetical protein